MPKSIAEQLDIIRRGTAEIISEAELEAKLKLNRPLVIKAGFDPTAPDLHLGHTVLLRKLRHFQDLGHTVVFLIGDYTAMIGDPTGQSATRPPLTKEQVQQNARTYTAQVSRILNLERLQVRFNSEWLEHMNLLKLIELFSRQTVARVLERDDFQQRLKSDQDFTVLEFTYPLLQGYDSVMLQADVELGGTDQKFNLLMGRRIQRRYDQEQQVVITMPLLEGTDGVNKMSKSLGNHIGISEPPNDMFGKLMSIPDALITKYFTLLTDAPSSRVMEIGQGIEHKTLNPRDAKIELAKTIVAMYHSEDAATQAAEEFSKIFSRKESPSNPQRLSITLHEKITLNDVVFVDVVALLVHHGLAKTNNDARRLLKQKAVKLNGVVWSQSRIPESDAVGLFQVGPRQFRKLEQGSKEN